MYELDSKFGSRVIPTSPRSPTGSVASFKAGVGSSLPFWMTRTSPVCWITNNLPSGAATIPVGSTSPRATTTWEKPLGRFDMSNRGSMPSTLGRNCVLGWRGR